MPSPPRFIYFDLGKVLVDFSTERMLRQVAEAADLDLQGVHDALFGRALLLQHETGRLDARGLYEAFCRAVDRRPSFDVLLAAATDIFRLNLPVLPLVAQLGQAGIPMGILSNTGEAHWSYCFGRYRIVAEGFAVHALSYRIGAVKPDGAVFRAAAELAGRWPEEIFFVDDRAEHVAAARVAGFDAVQFTTAPALAAELRRRRVRFNY